jgi:hypothetical protein
LFSSPVAPEIFGQWQVNMTRRILLNRRAHQVIDVDHDGHRYRVGVGRFEDGRPAEIFITSTKVGTAADINARDGALLLSLLLQHNVGIDAIVASISPAGLLGQVARLIGGAE